MLPTLWCLLNEAHSYWDCWLQVVLVEEKQTYLMNCEVVEVYSVLHV
jgi:hypothetical protein